MADVVARCAAREVHTPTQYVERWTEVAAVARERTRELVGALERPNAKGGSGGRGKRREAACARRLSEVRDGAIRQELRWNRSVELAASLELTAIEASLLTVVSMFCVTGAVVCWETRAELMDMARIKTNASFAAAVATLMRHGLLVPVNGAPRTAWYLGEGFWGGLLGGEELDTPVAKLVRGRKRAAERQAGPHRAGQCEMIVCRPGRRARRGLPETPRHPAPRLWAQPRRLRFLRTGT